MALKKEVKRIYWGLSAIDTVKELIAKFFLWLDEEEGKDGWK
jgi:hypothetical protein